MIIQPNIYSKVRYPPRLLEIVSIYGNLNDKLIVKINSSALDDDINEYCYFIGKQAMDSGNQYYNTNILDIESIADSKISVINTVAHIAAYVAKQSCNDRISNVSIKADVEMITALPGNQYKEAELFSSKFMSGVHRVEVITSIKKSIYIDIYFSRVKTMLKGVSSIFYIQGLADEDILFKELTKVFGSKPDKNYFENMRILHCIIGDGTTDFSITSKDGFTNLCSLQNGTGHATERILHDFRHANCLPSKFTRQDIYLALQGAENKYNCMAAKMIKNEIEWEFQSVFSALERIVVENKKHIDLIIVYGGGSLIMKNYLNDGLCKLEKITGVKSYIVNKENATTLEVKGMYSLLDNSVQI